MKILEVRDGFIKFESDSSLCLSSFVQVSGVAKNYIAQIIQIKRSGINSIAVAKILFLYDGSLQPYDKTLPPDDAQIKDFTFNILNNSINASEPVIAGVMPDKDLNIIIDSPAFNKKMLMSIDDKDENNILIRNLTKQFNNLGKNVLIIDTLGVINAKKYTAGEDFKLPLDTASLAFMYQDCLNDATGDSKALIVEIFRDLAEYSKTVPFVPFEALKNIVDEMVDKSHVFKLLVLKNKLAKFDRLGYFAKDKNEVDKVQKILDTKCAIVDLSKLDSAFQNRYLAFLYEKLKGREDVQVFLELSNTVSKKNLKNILEDTVPTTFITHSRFKYLNDIKNLFDNFLITPSLTNNEIFKVYNTFLKAMSKGTYLIAGEAVNYIPLVSAARIIDEIIPIARNTVQEAEQQDMKAPEEEPPAQQELAETSEEEEALQTEKEEDVSAVSESEEQDVSLEEIPAEDSEPEENEQEIAEPEIVEPEIMDDIEAAQEASGEEVIESRISKEEILANIAEKSDAVITDAAADLTPPSGNMFESDEAEEDEVENTLEEEGVSQENFQSEDVNDEILEELSLEPEEADENIPVENDLQIDGEPLTEAALDSDSNVLEEISLEEAFDNDAETVEEIQDYIPEEDVSEEQEEVELVDETETEMLPEDEPLTEESLEDVESETEVEVPEEFDLELEEEDENTISPEQLPDMDELRQDAETKVLPVSEESSDFDEIIELDPDEADENDIVIDMTEDDENLDATENLDEQIVKDVDKVFTTRKDDDISDSDLDFIDELNSDDGVLEEVSDADSSLEELSEYDEVGVIREDSENTIELQNDKDDEILETRNSSTPIVPVYDADIPQEDMVVSDPIQQGDTVTHAKYGSGVVEKMIKYGNKTLFSINFDNIGRRLLDPTLTEIKKA